MKSNFYKNTKKYSKIRNDNCQAAGIKHIEMKNIRLKGKNDELFFGNKSKKT